MHPVLPVVDRVLGARLGSIQERLIDEGLLRFVYQGCLHVPLGSLLALEVSLVFQINANLLGIGFVRSNFCHLAVYLVIHYIIGTN